MTEEMTDGKTGRRLGEDRGGRGDRVGPSEGVRGDRGKARKLDVSVNFRNNNFT